MDYVCKPEQKVLFECERINFAWGFFHSGWFIDSEGYVRAYVKPENWHFPNAYGMIVDTAMFENLVQADSICMQIDARTLSSKVSLIEQASKGELTEPVNEMFDFGAISYNCYTYDSDKEIYHCFLLDQYGDFVIKNKSAAANELYLWLRDITMQIAP